MKKIVLTIFSSLIFSSIFSQVRIDASFPFQNDPAKKYSLYIPSNYSSGIPNKAMVAFHPLNTSRWDSESWCDTLTQFAETNNLILICPDGGSDGAVDDPIDTAFTTTLIDSASIWYNIDLTKLYAIGFSVGGSATYTYGLNHPNKIKGFIPIGAAINGTSEVNGKLQHSTGKPYYLVHGTMDSPNTRFYPIRDSLINRSAFVNYKLMSGVGHTIDFPNRNQILTTAFNWIDSVNCSNFSTSIFSSKKEEGILIYPNPVYSELNINLVYNLQPTDEIKIVDSTGKLIKVLTGMQGKNFTYDTSPLSSGIYYIVIPSENKKDVKSKFIIVK